MNQTRIGALEVVPNVPMGLDLATLRVEQSYSMKRIPKIWGKENTTAGVYIFASPLQAPLAGATHLPQLRQC